MGGLKSQGKVIQFSHLTSSHSTSDASHSSTWFTEVLSSSPHESSIVDHSSEPNDGKIETSSNSASTPSSNSDVPTPCKKKKECTISFVNLTGAPTKDVRNRARKLATVARKEEKKERLHRKEREAILAAFSASTDNVAPVSRSYKPLITTPTSPKLGQISWFGGSRSDPFIKYPFELSYQERQLLDHIFYVECGTIKPYKEAFFPVGLTDEAAFHQVLANLTVQLGERRRPGCKILEYEKREVVAHHATALALVYKRLSDPETATSEGTIATVIAMICYSHLTKDLVAWHSHIKGLRQLLNLQRDFRSPCIEKYRSLRMGFFGLDTLLGPALSWIDANSSATLDIPPRFPFSPYGCLSPPDILQAQPSAAALLLSTRLLNAFPSGRVIFDLFKEAAIFAAVFKAEIVYTSPSKLYQDPMWSWTHLYPLAHNLLSYRAPVDIDDCESVIKESCRLALSIFVTQVRRMFGIAPLVLDIYVEQLLPLLQNDAVPQDWAGFNDFKLWVLVMGVTEARGEVRDGLLVLLRDVMKRLGIRTHWILEGKVNKLIWIDNINGPRLWGLEKRLWECTT